MRNRVLKIVMGFGLFGLLSSNYAADTIRLTVGDWSPYIENTPPGYGDLSQIMQEAFAQVGVEAKFQFEPWKRVENGLDSQNYYSFGYIKTTDRLTRWLYSDSMLRSRSILISTQKHKNFSWQNWGDLKSYRLGITQAYSYGETFEQYKAKLKTVSSYSDVVSLKALLHDRVDFVLMDSRVAAALIEQNFNVKERADFVLLHDTEVAAGELHFVCAIKNPNCITRVAQFNQGLAKLTASGRLKQLQALD
ncbi:transporter substrate-binding domain-containing protein [Deefgea tanakiae]|uniref:Transporter substrate-binding domain-containing protein n=1 Tax=Deefgea tanakiae TaxID=2865840 RepID=A0ABX8Z7J6_9NEIS|nr:transporter substrate-binding domain-containing protein [Deefgea tanakiae]QZA78561.1 transporter substrate-binding domain-containing protein [Deefgea tanakiae]